MNIKYNHLKCNKLVFLIRQIVQLYDLVLSVKDYSQNLKLIKNIQILTDITVHGVFNIHCKVYNREIITYNRTL